MMGGKGGGTLCSMPSGIAGKPEPLESKFIIFCVHGTWLEVPAEYLISSPDVESPPKQTGTSALLLVNGISLNGIRTFQEAPSA